MPRYRIHRIKEGPSESFRWSAHIGGLAVLKIKDYEQSGEVEAATPYAAWKALRTGPNPLRPGDVLELINGSEDGTGVLLVAKYVGFEPAQWAIPEPKPQVTTAASKVLVSTESQGAPA